ncbi:MAG TPA: bifunctional methylenetetrahydrofolate dehydrogenase/methenyltetrahydrofolate cyclohydrolase FolD [Thermoanaerobaculia bacterium]|nr:bifunctional methylenetetrahydrofolate dehydrogenase/methenyltetrahydrofolate cyclohydrolase FolD [Thermoanaerobaculia bacterium]HUM29310.1 bifunctional methylenetetrahydrofolate dehydrogenase/methenyltetrahydrofolate cyclohydrolase FolD [Thermoanaerobaculia bacterium]HXK67732.1 bifunctional methylenetetrahydrofolate dehydrogenase/methenyltetrahydrofolate cyclohydrolase FolD [Thermoanaerobaculia bacterium]
MAEILDGKTVADQIRENVRQEVEILQQQGITPSLHVLLVGEDPASQIYVSSKTRACEEVGIRGVLHTYPDTLTREELLRTIDELNRDPEVDGILVQLPLPGDLPEFEVTLAIDPAKDVDGFHPVNVGLLSMGKAVVKPCTPAGIMELLYYFGIPLKGARAVVIGRSNIVGKPMAQLLLAEHATVTLCHSRTRDLPAVAREADILVAAIGRPGMVDRSFVRDGAVVIDVGVNKLTDAEEVSRFFSSNEKKRSFFERKGYVLIGDVHYDDVEPVASRITPVPGGVGPLTIAMLMKNTLMAARARRNIK